MNINTVDAPALELLPGVGPVLARRIVEDRTHAPFRSVGDLPRVKGIAEYTASRIAKHVVFGPSP
ncbi:MAG: hypothetical protein CMJ49_09860 [Planctomycetaceae bacterium]|nr:hypothetical protein [Planctomycetaceae bacterium]